MPSSAQVRDKACAAEHPVFQGARHNPMIVLWVFRCLVGKIVERGSGGGAKKGAGCEGLSLVHPGHQCQTVSVLGGLLALNLLREPRKVGFTMGHYRVLLHHWSRLGWVHMWSVGKACMWLPRWGNILTLPAPVNNPRHERSYDGDMEMRGTVLSVTRPTKPTKTLTSSPSTPMGVAEAAEPLYDPLATTHFRSVAAAVQALGSALLCEVCAQPVSHLISRTT